MRPLKYLPHYTNDDYRMWEGDWELIDGLPYAMSPSANMKHQRIAGFMFNHILKSLEAVKTSFANCITVYGLDWVIEESTTVRPDIAIVCNNTVDFITVPPVLIIEVLSPSSGFKDRQVKFDLYQDQGVKYYLIVDPDAKKVTIYSLKNNLYSEQKRITDFVIHENCKFQIDFEKLLKGFK